MPYRICKTFEIESGHLLARHPDKCRFPHGHTRKVEVLLEAEELDENGMVCDFKVIKEAASAFLDTFDHALCVNTADPMYRVLREAYGAQVIPFENTEPTTEVLARHFFTEIERLLTQHAAQGSSLYHVSDGVRLVRVRVWETSSSWAEYFRNVD